MAKSIVKLTETLAIVKVIGTTGTTETITLATDLLSSTQVVSGTPTVGIGFIQWSCAADATITRNASPVFYMCNNSGDIDFSGNGGMLEMQGSTSDIVVTLTGNTVVYLTLRKVGGYASKIETAQYSVYDNTTAVGS